MLIHRPAWVDQHTGGSWLTPTVHRCPKGMAVGGSSPQHKAQQYSAETQQTFCHVFVIFCTVCLFFSLFFTFFTFFHFFSLFSFFHFFHFFTFFHFFSLCFTFFHFFPLFSILFTFFTFVSLLFHLFFFIFSPFFSLFFTFSFHRRRHRPLAQPPAPEPSDDFFAEYGTVQWSSNEWTIYGSARVSSKASLNLVENS